MKNTILILVALFTLSITSCKKQEVEPYYNYNEPTDTTNIDEYYQDDIDDYTYGGTLPNLGADSSFLKGTKWILTSFRRNGYLYNDVNDTIEFVSNNKYVVYKNGASAEKTYTLMIPTGSPAGTYNLTLNQFFPFGSSDNYGGLITEDVITFGEIYTDFEGNYYGDKIKEGTFRQI